MQAISRIFSFPLLAAIFLTALCSAVFAPPAFAQTPACTWVNPSATQQITGPDSVCYLVTNTNASSPMCVPTVTAGEWQSFYHSPGAATLAACQCAAGTASWGTYCSAPVGALNYGANTGVTNTASGYTGSATVTCSSGSYSYSGASCSAACGGTLVGGYCWYEGANGASCDTTCTGHGGYNAATLSYAGSGGTDANCLAVLTALSMVSGSVTDMSFYAYGCVEDQNAPTGHQRTRYTVATTSSASGTSVYRACACNN